ncbi:MAG TPA: hypothetical protein VH309_06595 [Elusimicrobiota bacterium]|nr:hypothetical protein [Elusimicrobiota bacterium]
MRKEKPGPQGLANLKTWRLAFSSDVKRRRRQTQENRRTHRVRPPRPDSVLGTPEMNWTEPPKLGPSGTARRSDPKHRGEPMHEPGFFARKVNRLRHRSLRHGRKRP